LPKSGLPRLISGDEEAELAGLGVISAIPKANGTVADLVVAALS
jgi:exopolyphosphatase/pppGpp-phosphohydrolase